MAGGHVSLCTAAVALNQVCRFPGSYLNFAAVPDVVGLMPATGQLVMLYAVPMQRLL